MGERIALGLGDNVDYEIAWEPSVYEELVLQYHVQPEELVIGKPINTERDLLVSILAYLQSGRGGEQWVATSELIEQFAQRFDNKITLGGSSVRAAIAMRKLGYTSALHLVTINDHVRRLIPNDSPYVCSNDADTLYPHLIVQFSDGTTVKSGNVDLRARRSNRIIYHNDVDNIRMAIDEEFADLCADADVLLISGFNAMHEEALLRNRLGALVRILDRLPTDTQVFYEDGGFYDHAFTHTIFETLQDRLDLVSMNEDELQMYLGRSVDILDVTDVIATLEDVQKIVPAPVIVLHSMHWALAFGAGAQQYEAALRGGATMATTRYVHGDDFTAAEYRSIEATLPNRAGDDFACWIMRSRADDVCCVPVAHVECTAPTTIGLGDAFVGGFLPALLK